MSHRSLSFYMDADGPMEQFAERAIDNNNNAITIEVEPNGPFHIKSDCIIIHDDGREEYKTSIISLCRCGASANQPYCDGSHKEINFKI